MTILSMVIMAVCYFASNIFQNQFSGSLAGRKYPLPLFQGFWMGIAAVIMIIIKCFMGDFHFSEETIIISVFSGVFMALGGMMLVLALEKGAMSLTILLFSANPVIPTILSIFLLKERTTVFQVFGMILIIIVFILINLNKEDMGMKMERGWFLYSALSALFTGLSSFCTKLQQTRLPDLEQTEYMIALYVSGLIIMLICFVYLFRRERNFRKEKYIFGTSGFILPAIMVALVQGMAMLCSLYNSSRVPAIILFPVTQLLTLILTTIFSIIRLGERPERKTVLCMLIGITAIVIMNF